MNCEVSMSRIEPVRAAQMAVTGGAADVRNKGIGPLALRLARGSLIYVLANFGIKALNFFLFPLYTRFLSPADYGIVSVAETFAAVLMAVLGLGLDAGVCRLYFQYVGDPAQLEACINSLLLFAVMSTVLAVSVVLLLGQRLLTCAA